LAERKERAFCKPAGVLEVQHNQAVASDIHRSQGQNLADAHARLNEVLKPRDRVTAGVELSLPNTRVYNDRPVGGIYDEKLDIYVDGELQPRPQTNWS
jgi:hypothetical protein